MKEPQSFITITPWSEAQSNTLSRTFKHLFKYRSFVKELVRIDLTAVYKKSYASGLWVLLAPLFQVVIWVMLHLTGILEPGETGIPYPAYVFVSISFWMLFRQAYESISHIMVQQGRLLLMNKFPSEVLISSRIAVLLFRFSVPLVVTIGFLLAVGVKLSWSALIFPFALIPLLFLGVGLGLFWSLMRVVSLDSTHLFDRFIEFLMFLTPVIYAKTLEFGFLSTIIKFNPLTYLVDYPRSLLTIGWSSPSLGFVLSSFLAVMVLLFGLLIFQNRSARVLEKLVA
jgi:lipopolysaccharide transport system permease protein